MSETRNGFFKWGVAITTIIGAVLALFGFVMNSQITPLSNAIARMEVEMAQTRGLASTRGQELINLRADQRRMEDEIVRLRDRIERPR